MILAGNSERKHSSITYAGLRLTCAYPWLSAVLQPPFWIHGVHLTILLPIEWWCCTLAWIREWKRFHKIAVAISPSAQGLLYFFHPISYMRSLVQLPVEKREKEMDKRERVKGKAEVDEDKGNWSFTRWKSNSSLLLLRGLISSKLCSSSSGASYWGEVGSNSLLLSKKRWM